MGKFEKKLDEALTTYGEDMEKARDRYEHIVAHGMMDKEVECPEEYEDDEEEPQSLFITIVARLMGFIVVLIILTSLLPVVIDYYCIATMNYSTPYGC